MLANVNRLHIIVGAIVVYVGLVFSTMWLLLNTDSQRYSSTTSDHELYRLLRAMNDNSTKLIESRLEYLANKLDNFAPMTSTTSPPTSQNSHSNDIEQVCADCERHFNSFALTVRRPIHIKTTVTTFWIAEWYSLSPVPDCPVLCFLDPKPQSINNPRDVDGLVHSESPGMQPNRDVPINMYFTVEAGTDIINPYSHSDLSQRINITLDFHLQDDEVIQRARRNGHKWTHIPLTYAPVSVEQMYEPPWHTFREKLTSEALATAFTSKCDNDTYHKDRTQLLGELIEGMSVHSYGRCHNNRAEHEAISNLGCQQWDRATRYGSKLCIISKSLFYFAFDHHHLESYVTEKLFHAFVAGTVPVYLGAPNIDKFDPMYGRVGPRSIIKATDFATTADLIAHLKYLASNETAYNEYLYWKSLPPAPFMRQLIEYSYFSPRAACRVCQATAYLLQQSGRLNNFKSN